MTGVPTDKITSTRGGTSPIRKRNHLQSCILLVSSTRTTAHCEILCIQPTESVIDGSCLPVSACSHKHGSLKWHNILILKKANRKQRHPLPWPMYVLCTYVHMLTYVRPAVDTSIFSIFCVECKSEQKLRDKAEPLGATDAKSQSFATDT